MVLLEFSMIPLDQGESFSDAVAELLDIVDRSGLDYRLTPMGTIVEGEWDEAMAVMHRCFERLGERSERISATARIDYRKGRSGRLVGKVESVERKLGRRLRTGDPTR